MNQVVANVESSSSEELYRMKDFDRQKGMQTRWLHQHYPPPQKKAAWLVQVYFALGQQGPFLCKTVFPWTMGGVGLGMSQVHLFTVQFISNLMLPLIQQEIPVGDSQLGDPCFRGVQKASWANDLTSTDQMVPDWLVYLSISGRTKTILVSLSLMMWSLVIPSGGLSSCFQPYAWLICLAQLSGEMAEHEPSGAGVPAWLRREATSPNDIEECLSICPDF